MSTAPLVSIVLAVYNGAFYLSRQMESLLSQTHSHVEIIVCDDRSDDTSLSLAQQFAEKDRRVRIFSNTERLGVSANFLGALRHANGEFVCFSDQDDDWRQDKIEILIGRIENNQKNMLVYSDLEICDKNLKMIHPSFWKASGIAPVCGKMDERILIRNLAPGCSMLFRKAVKDKMIGLGIDSPFMHDHLALVTSCVLGEIVFSPETLVKYRQHQNNVIGSQTGAAFDGVSFSVELKKRITFFKSKFGAQNIMDCDRLMGLCQFYAGKPKLLGRFLYLKYFLFMRPRGFKFGLLGAIECIFPRFYRMLKHLFIGEKLS